MKDINIEYKIERQNPIENMIDENHRMLIFNSSQN